MAVKVGDRVPDVSLKTITAEGPKDVKFSDWKGKKLVILFYPLTNTGVCEKELCTVRDDYASYGKVGAEVVAVSVDSPFSQKLWKDKMNFPFALLSDFNKTAIAAFGNGYEDLIGLKGVAKRSAYVVDAAGVVKYVWVTDNAKDLPDLEAIKKAVASL